MGPSDVVGFLDESRKPVRLAHIDGTTQVHSQSFYAVAAALVPVDRMKELREGLRKVSQAAPKALHYADLTRRRRVRALELLVELPHWHALAVETDTPVKIRNDRLVRGAVLSAALQHLHDVSGVTHLTLETRSDPRGGFARLDHDDVLLVDALRQRGILHRPLTIRHSTKVESLLAIADLVVGARTDSICGVDDAPWGHVASRVTVLQVSPRWADPRNAEAPGH